jgi:hypothetical protein
MLRCPNPLLAASALPAGVLATALAAAACDGVLKEQTGGGDVDAGPLAMIEPPACLDVQPAGEGHHHPGEDCLMCHHQGGDGPPFTFGGTLFTSSGGTKEVVGATLHLIDAAGTDVVVTTSKNGNFWSTDLVTFPVVAFATLCPDVKPMIAPLEAGDGSCNRAGCHTSGFRLHLP